MLDGMPLNKFITKLVDVATNQGAEVLVHVLGKRYLDLGVWKEHRDINKMVKLYGQWGRNFIEKRIKEEKEKAEKS